MRTIGTIALSTALLLTLHTIRAGDRKEKEPAPVVVTEAMTGKTLDLKVGQLLEIRLKGDRKQTGWETAIGQLGVKDKPPLEYVSQKFDPEPKAGDEAIGTYTFRYKAGKEGEQRVRIAFLYPGGPIPAPRLATQLVREFTLNVKIAKE